MPFFRGDAGIFARLTIPADRRSAWLAAELDWKSVEGHELLRGYIGGETVADVIEDVCFVETSEFLELSWSGDELTLLSFQSAAGWSESVVGFAAAWAASAGFGGRGQLCGIGVVGTAFGYRVEVADGRAWVSEIADDQLAAFAAEPGAVALRERMAALGGVFADKLKAPPPVPRVRRAVVADAPAKPASKKKAAAKKKTNKK